MGLTSSEYDRVRADGPLFLNAHGHVAAAQQHARVVEETERYAVVDKIGRAGEITRELDPRNNRRS